MALLMHVSEGSDVFAKRMDSCACRQMTVQEYGGKPVIRNDAETNLRGLNDATL